MVQGQNEVVFLFGGLDQAGAQQRSGLQIERLVRFVVGQLLDLPLADLGIQRGEILPRHAHAGLRVYLLAGDAVDARERGAQGFVTQDQGLQRGLEARHVEHATQPRHAADVVGRAVGLHLPEEPHALLGIGQRHRLPAVDFFNRRLFVGAATGLDQANLFGKRTEFAVLEQRPQRQLDVAGLAGAGDDLRGQQRVTAEGKKIIAQTDLRQTQHFAPDAGDVLFQFCHRLDVLANLPLRFRQRAAVELAARAEGHFVQAHQLRRHHVFRQFGGQCAFQARGLLDLVPGIVRSGVVTDQLRPGHGVAHQHHGLRNAVLGQQPCLDFLRLDPEPAQLDLLIETTEVFDHAIRRPACPVAGAIQACARLAQRIDHKSFGGQRRATEVTTGQANAADAQLTRHTDRNGMQIAVEHAADHIAQRPANRRAFAIGAGALPVGDVDRGFGRSVAVVKLHRRQLRQHPVAQLRGQGLAPGEQPAQAGAFSTERFVDEQRKQRRHEVQRGHAVRLHQLRDAMWIAVFAGTGDQQTCACDQRPEALPHRHVETDRRLLHQHVGFVQAISVLHPLQALGQRRVGVTDAFGLAGGTGGINHIGKIVAVQMQPRRMAWPTVQVQGVHGDHTDTLAGRQALEQSGVRQQQLNTAVAEHVGQAFGGVIRVQRHVGATGLDDRQQADQQLRRTLAGDGHADVRADAFVAQVMGQTVGLGVEFGEVHLAALPDQRRAPRCQPGLLVERFGQPLTGRCAGCAGPVRLLMLLGGRQQRQVTDGDVRLLADSPQQVAEMVGQALDGRGVEQFVGVVEGQGQATVAVFFAVQLHIELGFAAMPRQLFGQQPRQALQGAKVALLMVEHDLEQALFTGLREGFEQLLERQVLMRLRTQRRLTGLRQQLNEWQT
ncbi:hypothetical protein D3C80_255740 [compost metagenome]